MKFEWDESKRCENIAKHGLDFADAAEVFNLKTAVAHTKLSKITKKNSRLQIIARSP